jgi:hypothetical protein
VAKGEVIMGKGSSPRPIPNRKKFEDNWDNIFGKKDKDGNKSDTVDAKKTKK